MPDFFEPQEISIRLNLWDTVGTERYNAMNRRYFNDAVCTIIVYDVTDNQSLSDATKWLAMVENYCPSNTLKVLCGNKVDLYEERSVDQAEAKSFLEDYEIDLHFEVSAKDGT